MLRHFSTTSYLFTFVKKISKQTARQANFTIRFMYIRRRDFERQIAVLNANNVERGFFISPLKKQF